jgi:plastocyanin
MKNFLGGEMSQFTYRYDEEFYGGGDVKFDSNGNIYLLDWGIHVLNPLPDSNTIHVASNSSNTSCAEWQSDWSEKPYLAFTCVAPFNAQVEVGEIVTWINKDSSGHTVTSGTPEDGPDGLFESSFLNSGDSFSFVFDTAGEYEYFDLTHPWVKGIVTVVEGP